MNFLVLLVVLDSTSAGVPNIHRRQEEVRHRYEAEEIDSDDFLASFLENFPEISDESRRKPISTSSTDPVRVPIEDQFDTIEYSNPRDDEHVLFQEVPDKTIGNFASTIMTDPIPFKQETASKLEARSDIVTRDWLWSDSCCRFECRGSVHGILRQEKTTNTCSHCRSAWNYWY